MNQENNQAILKGVFSDVLEFYSNYKWKPHYRTFLNIERNSGTIDSIPVVLTEKELENEYAGKTAELKGRCHGFVKDGHSAFFIRPKEIIFLDEVENENSVELTGFVCIEPVYKTTPSGRVITDTALAITRANGVSDYVFCLFWGNNAIAANKLKVGEEISVSGRIQSRDYMKAREKRTVYELSVKNFERKKNDIKN